MLRSQLAELVSRRDYLASRPQPTRGFAAATNLRNNTQPRDERIAAATATMASPLGAGLRRLAKLANWERRPRGGMRDLDHRPCAAVAGALGFSPKRGPRHQLS